MATDGILNLAPGEHVDVRVAGTPHVVRLRRRGHRTSDGAVALELRGLNCDLEGEMPGLYYPVAKQPTTASTDVESRVRELAEVFNTGTPDEVIRYVRDGYYDAAAEVLSTEAHLHAAAMNQTTADAFFALANDILRRTR